MTRPYLTRRCLLASGATTGIASLAGCSLSNSPSLSTPDEVLVDEAFTLQTSGLSDFDEFEVRAETTGADGRARAASATFQTDGTEGSLDGAKLVDAPYTGDLSVPHTMALLQFLAPTGEHTGYTPRAEETVSFTASVGGEEKAATSLTRFHGSPDVTQSSVDHETVVGTLYEPSGDGTAPGVVVLHASDGRPDTLLAKMLASNGFVALALRYFGGNTPNKTLFEIPLSYVETAINWVLNREQVSGGQVGLVGDSRGGELALLAGSEFESVGPVVSRNGSGVVWPGFSSDGFNAGSAWTRNGSGVSYVPFVEDRSLWSSGELEPAYTKSLEQASERTIADATIPVENIDGPLLFVSGLDDAVWDAERLQDIAVNRLEENDRSNYEHLTYENAGHVTTIPYRPVVNLEARTALTIGGEPAGHAEASADHWPTVLSTLGDLK